MNEDLFVKKVTKLEEDVAEIKQNMATKADIQDILSTLGRQIGLYQTNQENLQLCIMILRS